MYCSLTENYFLNANILVFMLIHTELFSNVSGLGLGLEKIFRPHAQLASLASLVKLPVSNVLVNACPSLVGVGDSCGRRRGSVALLQRRLCDVGGGARLDGSGRRSSRCGRAGGRSVRPAAAATVPAASSAAAAAPDRPAGRRRGTAGLKAGARSRRFAHRRRRPRSRLRLPSRRRAGRRAAVPRDCRCSDDVTAVADVGHDRHVAQAAESTAESRPRAICRPSVELICLNFISSICCGSVVGF